MKTFRTGFLLLVLIFSSAVVNEASAFDVQNFTERKAKVSFQKNQKKSFVPAAASSDRLEQQIFDLVNEQRRKNRLRNLIWDDDLSDLARAYSEQMWRENFFDHFDSDGNSVVDRAGKFRIKGYREIGENLFYSEGYSDPTNIAVKGWLKSPTHRKNMLYNSWVYSGIGVYVSRTGKTFVTQVFLR